MSLSGDSDKINESFPEKFEMMIDFCGKYNSTVFQLIMKLV